MTMSFPYAKPERARTPLTGHRLLEEAKRLLPASHVAWTTDADAIPDNERAYIEKRGEEIRAAQGVHAMSTPKDLLARGEAAESAALAFLQGIPGYFGPLAPHLVVSGTAHKADDIFNQTDIISFLQKNNTTFAFGTDALSGEASLQKKVERLLKSPRSRLNPLRTEARHVYIPPMAEPQLVGTTLLDRRERVDTNGKAFPVVTQSPLIGYLPGTIERADASVVADVRRMFALQIGLQSRLLAVICAERLIEGFTAAGQPSAADLEEALQSLDQHGPTDDTSRYFLKRAQSYLALFQDILAGQRREAPASVATRLLVDAQQDPLPNNNAPAWRRLFADTLSPITTSALQATYDLTSALGREMAGAGSKRIYQAAG